MRELQPKAVAPRTPVLMDLNPGDVIRVPWSFDVLYGSPVVRIPAGCRILSC